MREVASCLRVWVAKSIGHRNATGVTKRERQEMRREPPMTYPTGKLDGWATRDAAWSAEERNESMALGYKRPGKARRRICVYHGHPVVLDRVLPPGSSRHRVRTIHMCKRASGAPGCTGESHR